MLWHQVEFYRDKKQGIWRGWIVWIVSCCIPASFDTWEALTSGWDTFVGKDACVHQPNSIKWLNYQQWSKLKRGQIETRILTKTRIYKHTHTPTCRVEKRSQACLKEAIMVSCARGVILEMLMEENIRDWYDRIFIYLHDPFAQHSCT